MSKIIYESDLPELLFSLSKKYRVFAPTVLHEHSTASRIGFCEYEKGNVLALNYSTTILPPKEFLIPPKEVLFKTVGKKSSYPTLEEQLLFGLSLEDLEGIF